MVGQGLEEVVAQVPSHREAVGRHAHQLPLGAQPLEEEDELQLEEDHRVHARPAAPGVEGTDRVAHEREVQLVLQAPVEVVLGYEVLERCVLR